MGDAILRIPRDARVRAYRTRDTYDGVVPATSKRQPYCHSSGKFGNVERNSHCDVLRITPVRVARLFLDCNGVFAIKAYSHDLRYKK